MKEADRSEGWGRVGCGRVRVREGERREGEKGIRKGEVKIETSGKGKK